MNDLHREHRRLEALHALEIISSGRDPAMDQICALACDIFSVPVAVVTLLDAEHQWLKARCGLDVESTPRGVAFCNYTIQSDDVLVVPNALEDKRFASNPLVTDGLKIRFYAGAPLELEPGIRLGALCLIDYEPRSFSEQDRHRLAQLALLVVSQIRLHAANLELKTKAEQLEARQAELEWTATHDGLTRLPNRSLFQKNLHAAVETPETGVGGLMIIDLDEFKQINDTLGHEAGDALLVAVGERLSSLVEAPATVARLGGDEFAILTPDVPDVTKLLELADNVTREVSQPVQHDRYSFNCTASVGIAVFPDHACTPTEVLRSADLALYTAKGEGRNRAVLYYSELRDRFQARIDVLDRARHALEDDAIIPYYQPKVSLITGEVVGFEALLRWRDPILGIQTPKTIWEAFSDPVLSIAIGHRMRRMVLADMVEWTKRGVTFGAVAINVSAAEFTRGDFAKHILDSLETAGLPTDVLELEVTETVFLGDGSGDIGEALSKLSDAGIAIALDDFGTGYASLTHLRQFPVGWLKVDRSFISDMTQSRESASIVGTVIELSHSLEIGVVAEGIETMEQLDMLKAWNCEVGQGYLFGKPMDADLVPGLLATWSFPQKKEYRRA